MKTITAIATLALAGTTAAQTTEINPSRFRVETGVAFELLNQGAANYLFAWTDASGSFSGLVDPTLEIVAGQTYTFQRFSGSHPFAICDDTLPVSGEDGEIFRTSPSISVINAATLAPIADFTANPAPTTDLITWTPSEADVGVYYYTCTIAGHLGMTGAIEVIPAAEEPCLADVNGDGIVSPADFTAWVIAFNSQLPACDQNGDGLCQPNDFSAWVVNFNAGC
ncbi:MAG: cupredoxin domain-containing protein [Planctomycetota bacterium]